MLRIGRLHWVLDVTMDEDRARNRKGNGARCLAVVRRLALDIARLHPSGISPAASSSAHRIATTSCSTWCGRCADENDHFQKRLPCRLGCSTTPAARRLASVAGSSCSYAEADRLLAELAGVNYGAKRIERATRAVGEDPETRHAAALSGSALGDVPGAGAFAPPARKPLKEGEMPCVALDGTGSGAPGGDGGAARPGRGDGAHAGGEGRGAVAHGAGRRGRAADDAGGESPVARRLLRELAALGRAPRDVGVCLGEGADWLRRLYAEWFPNAVRIVDFFHAAEHLWAARARYDPDGDRATARNGGRRACACCSRRAAPAKCSPRCAGPAAGSANGPPATSPRRGRMRYGEYLARGLPIGSGRVEAACKTVVGRRMKYIGMRWSVAGANPVLQVRCAHPSGWFGDCWDDRLASAA